MKKNLRLILLMIMFVVGNAEVNASSGALRKDSIKTCDGVMYGQHSSDNHWHVAVEHDDRYYATGAPIYSDPCSSNSSSSSNNSSNGTINSSSKNDNSSNNNGSSTTSSSEEKVQIKSNDNTLKNITINGAELDVEDNIEYSTTEEKVIIIATPNSEKAQYEVKNNFTLEIGENKILIEVTAEDGTIKTYTVNVKRDKILSSDTDVKVSINEEEINFTNNKATVYVSATETRPKIDYVLNDKNAKVEMDNIKELKTGDNELKLKVIAEDGTEKEYEIIIHKNSKLEEIISTIFGLAIIGGMGYGMYYIIKKFVAKFKNIISKIKNKNQSN